MRKLAMEITALFFIAAQGSMAKTVLVAQNYADDSDVVLKSAVKEIKSAPRDTVDMVGDGVKFVSDEVVTTARDVVAPFKSNPVEKAEKAGMLAVDNAWDSSNDIIFRSYKVSPAVGEELLGNANVAEGDVVDVSSAFSGIDFPKNASAFFRPEFNRLFIRNTLENMFAIEDVLAELHSAERDLMGKQVSIETKFVEVNQTALDELGFDWSYSKSGGANLGRVTLSDNDLFTSALRTLSGGTIGTVTKTAAIGAGLANSDQLVLRKTAGSLNWNLIINALEQQDGTDVLSAPNILTRDGSTASILVGEERAVSTGFDVKNSESSLYIEHDLDLENFGVMLEVTPELRSDSLIDLELAPKVIDLIGYDDYTAHPDAELVAFQGSRNYALTDKFNMLALNARMPYYRLREMETQLTVADGSTVGMGGLLYDKLETFKDKVPVLGSIPLIGRLFRSEGERSVKRNLMIFVTATQVDVNGRKASDLALKK